jgi:UDP-N-acetylenolpyruvoylglucosamine reductase
VAVKPKGQTVIDDAEVERFQAGLRGPLLRPGDGDYDEARKVYNGMIDRYPSMIARCVDAADVITAVNFARENDVTVAVRGGSHSAPGLGVCDDGLVIDLAVMKGVRVDPDRRTVRVQGGCTWGDVDHATHAFGLAVPSGIVSTTGVAGLTLGGGHGYLTRKYGLTCDNLISADVVTADGRHLTASAEKNEDLFWALRGGGGNFGVVTSFEFLAHPVSVVYAGPVFWPIDKAEDALRLYRDFMADAPEEVYAFFAFLIVPPAPPFPESMHNQNVCGAVCCVLGDLDEAQAAVKPLLEFGPPLFQHIGPIPFPALQSLFDTQVPPGLHHYWKADLVKELSDEAIALNVQYGSRIPSLHSAMHLYPIDGAACRVGRNETAWSYRDAHFSQLMIGTDPEGRRMDGIISWVKEYWDALHPHSAGGAYVNFLMEEGQDRVKATYRDNYERLVAVKNRFDPQNLFHLNQNIKPTV